MKDKVDIQELSSLAQGFPYMPQVQDGVAFVDQEGACDPLMREQYQRENPFRFATAFFRWQRDAVAGALQLPSGTLTLFGNGAGQTGAGTGATLGATPLTRAETNAFAQGGIAKQGNRFIGVGLLVQPLAPFIVATGADAIGPNSTRRRPPWFNGGTNYPDEMLRLLFDATTSLVQHGQDNACSYDFGPLSYWANATPQQGYKPSLGVPGQFTFLAVPDVSGNTQDGFNLQLTLTVNEGLQVDSDAVNATVAGFDVVTPVRWGLVGFPICVDGRQSMSGGSCGVGANRDLDALVAAKMKEALARVNAEVPQLGDGKDGGAYGRRGRF